MSLRHPESCVYRQADSGSDGARCALIGELLSGISSAMSLVTSDICSVCCRSFLPTAEDLNPVMASLVWSRCDQWLTSGVASDDPIITDGLRKVCSFAEKSLPLVTIDGDELPPRPVSHTAGGRRSCEDVARHLPYPDGNGKPITQWTVGVTTAHRRLSTVGECVTSVCQAGWDSPHLFIDGEFDLPHELTSFPRTVRLPAVGAMGNFYLAIVELLRRSPADGLMLLQDDALWPSHLPIRDYFDRVNWPGNGRFVASPYCCENYTAKDPGWRSLDETWKYGAVALIFSRVSAEEFVADSRVIGYCQSETAGIDSLVGDWAARSNTPVFVPTPSLVQHIGEISTLWRTSRAVGMRRASRFIGDELAPITAEDEPG